ncbi:unnamed protein product [Adineta ricciae]|uniref:Uncharacterized protein n=1 Tax=Adineta ricciae TaxID=249248 RepID=A0A815GBI6_ADIRI|nr:unnamed protein product [Adineta ricciae]CAF1336246.1 unnamed protein product [Adineta ricciae]
MFQFFFTDSSTGLRGTNSLGFYLLSCYRQDENLLRYMKRWHGKMFLVQLQAIFSAILAYKRKARCVQVLKHHGALSVARTRDDEIELAGK